MADDIEVNSGQQPPHEEDDIVADVEMRVGYRRPPAERRFQPGKSGNPRGRPLGFRNRKKITERVLLEKHQVDIDGSGRIRKVTTLEVVLLKLRQRALEGNTQAFNEYNKLENQFVRPEASKKGSYLVIPEVDSWETWVKIFGSSEEDKDES